MFNVIFAIFPQDSTRNSVIAVGARRAIEILLTAAQLYDKITFETAYSVTVGE